MTTSDPIQTFVATCMPHVRRVGPRHWRGPAATAISYPPGAHADYRGLEEASFWFAHRNEIILSALRRWPPPGVVLDVGGGNGFVARALNRAGFATLVVEPSAEGCDAALRRELPVVETDLAGSMASEASVPAAALFDVLEHVADDGVALREVARCLKPGGMLYLTVPAHRWLWSGEDVTAGHYRRYSIAGLRGLLGRNRFEVVHAAHFFAILTCPVLILRAVPSALGLRRSGAPAPGREHRLPAGRLGAFVARRLDLERTGFGAERARFGTSIIVVARKPGA